MSFKDLLPGAAPEGDLLGDIQHELERDLPLHWKGDRAAEVMRLVRLLDGATLLVAALEDGVRQGLFELGPRTEDGQLEPIYWTLEINGVPALAKVQRRRNHWHNDDLEIFVALRPGPTARRWMSGSSFAYHMAWSFCDEASTVWIDRRDRPFIDGSGYWKARPKQVARRRLKELTSQS